MDDYDLLSRHGSLQSVVRQEEAERFSMMKWSLMLELSISE